MQICEEVCRLLEPLEKVMISEKKKHMEGKAWNEEATLGLGVKTGRVLDLTV